MSVKDWFQDLPQLLKPRNAQVRWYSACIELTHILLYTSIMSAANIVTQLVKPPIVMPAFQVLDSDSVLGNVPGKHARWLKGLGPEIHMGEPNGVPDSWFTYFLAL